MFPLCGKRKPMAWIQACAVSRSLFEKALENNPSPSQDSSTKPKAFVSHRLTSVLVLIALYSYTTQPGK